MSEEGLYSFGWTMIRGGPWALRARSMASGTSSRRTTEPMLGVGSSRPATMASSVRYQSSPPGAPPNWIISSFFVAWVTFSVSPVYQPPAGVDPRAHGARLDDLLQEAGRPDTLEDRRWRGHPALGRSFVPDVVGRPLRRVDRDVRAEAFGQLEAIVVEVGDDDRIDATSGERGDGREADRARRR